MENMQNFESIFSGIENYSSRIRGLNKFVAEWLYGYFSEKGEVEKMCQLYYQGNREDNSLELKIREENTKIFKKYWSNQSEYYAPRGFSSVRLYDWSKVTDIEAIQNHNEKERLIVCKYVYDKHAYAFLLKEIEGKLFIEHSFD